MDVPYSAHKKDHLNMYSGGGLMARPTEYLQKIPILTTLKYSIKYKFTEHKNFFEEFYMMLLFSLIRCDYKILNLYISNLFFIFYLFNFPQFQHLTH